MFGRLKVNSCMLAGGCRDRILMRTPYRTLDRRRFGMRMVGKLLALSASCVFSLRFYASLRCSLIVELNACQQGAFAWHACKKVVLNLREACHSFGGQLHHLATMQWPLFCQRWSGLLEWCSILLVLLINEVLMSTVQLSTCIS